MDRHNGRRQPLGKGHSPGKLCRSSVVVANEKTTDPADSLSNRQRGSSCGKHRDLGQALPVHHHETGGDPANKPAKPAHAPAAEEQTQQSILSTVLDDPEEFRAGKTTDYACERAVYGRRVNLRSLQLALEDPESDQRADGHHRAEAGDLERADPEEDWIHDGLNVFEAA